VVDVRVLGSNGSGRISSVVRGIEWVLANRAAYNIRVINLSFGAPPPLSYRLDPMSAAVEIAWRRGLVVVAASGTGGPQGNTVDTLFPERIVVAQNGSTYFRLTGTSMATGVVSGAAALLLERQPNLTPDQVKALLVGTTQRYGQDSGKGLPNPIADGSGLLDAYAAVNAAPAAAPSTALVPGGLVLSATQSVEPLACANHAL